jgi:hypothetical protein
VQFTRRTAAARCSPTRSWSSTRPSTSTRSRSVAVPGPAGEHLRHAPGRDPHRTVPRDDQHPPASRLSALTSGRARAGAECHDRVRASADPDTSKIPVGGTGSSPCSRPQAATTHRVEPPILGPDANRDRDAVRCVVRTQAHPGRRWQPEGVTRATFDRHRRPPRRSSPATPPLMRLKCSSGVISRVCWGTSSGLRPG